MKRDRVNRILSHDLFKEYLRLNEEAEVCREFCRHDIAHFLDVARIAAILNLREQQEVEEELIYAAALLHDIGRHIQYADGTPHEKASALLAPAILKDCGFDGKQIQAVLSAISAHRTDETAQKSGLDGLIYRGDKLSRSCFACKAEEKCDWKEAKKNKDLIW